RTTADRCKLGGEIGIPKRVRLRSKIRIISTEASTKSEANKKELSRRWSCGYCFQDGVVMHGSPDEVCERRSPLSSSMNIGWVQLYQLILRLTRLHPPLGEQVIFPKGPRFS